MKTFGFEPFDSKMDGYIDVTDVTPCNTEDFYAMYPSYAKLIYIHDDDLEHFLDDFGAYPTIEKNCEDLEKLRSLTKDSVVIVTKQELMRGVDYRIAEEARKDTDGISLLIHNTFDSRRSYIQGLGRVGRYNEKCQRFLHTSIKDPPVDNAKAHKINAKLS